MSYYEMPHLQEVLCSLERLLDLKITEADALVRIAEINSRVGEAEIAHDSLDARLKALEDQKETIRTQLP